jgi:hypothetical protein
MNKPILGERYEYSDTFVAEIIADGKYKVVLWRGLKDAFYIGQSWVFENNRNWRHLKNQNKL